MRGTSFDCTFLRAHVDALLDGGDSAAIYDIVGALSAHLPPPGARTPSVDAWARRVLRLACKRVCSYPDEATPTGRFDATVCLELCELVGNPDNVLRVKRIRYVLRGIVLNGNYDCTVFSGNSLLFPFKQK